MFNISIEWNKLAEIFRFVFGVIQRKLLIPNCYDNFEQRYRSILGFIKNIFSLQDYFI